MRVKIRKSGRTFDIVNVDTGEVVEGGFFARDAAVAAAKEYENA